jgi:hypothetical protein
MALKIHPKLEGESWLWEQDADVQAAARRPQFLPAANSAQDSIIFELTSPFRAS